MHRLNKSKDARRRARKQALRAAHAGAISTNQRVIPDKRRKPEKHRKPYEGRVEASYPSEAISDYGSTT